MHQLHQRQIVVSRAWKGHLERGCLEHSWTGALPASSHVAAVAACACSQVSKQRDDWEKTHTCSLLAASMFPKRDSHQTACWQATSLSGPSGSTAHEDVVPTVAIRKLGMRPACTGNGTPTERHERQSHCHESSYSGTHSTQVGIGLALP